MGRALDNIFTERLWRSLKHEEVYFHDYETPREARAGITRYMAFYNYGPMIWVLGVEAVLPGGSARGSQGGWPWPDGRRDVRRRAVGGGDRLGSSAVPDVSRDTYQCLGREHADGTAPAVPGA